MVIAGIGRLRWREGRRLADGRKPRQPVRAPAWARQEVADRAGAAAPGGLRARRLACNKQLAGLTPGSCQVRDPQHVRPPPAREGPRRRLGGERTDAPPSAAFSFVSCAGVSGPRTAVLEEEEPCVTRSDHGTPHPRAASARWSRSYALAALTDANIALTSAPEPADLLTPLDRLGHEDLAAFAAGDAQFAKPFAITEGLGPVFNNVSCASCHSGDGRGQPVCSRDSAAAAISRSTLATRSCRTARSPRRSRAAAAMSRRRGTASAGVRDGAHRAIPTESLLARSTE